MNRSIQSVGRPDDFDHAGVESVGRNAEHLRFAAGDQDVAADGDQSVAVVLEVDGGPGGLGQLINQQVTLIQQIIRAVADSDGGHDLFAQPGDGNGFGVDVADERLRQRIRVAAGGGESGVSIVNHPGQSAGRADHRGAQAHVGRVARQTLPGRPEDVELVAQAGAGSFGQDRFDLLQGRRAFAPVGRGGHLFAQAVVEEVEGETADGGDARPHAQLQPDLRAIESGPSVGVISREGGLLAGVAGGVGVGDVVVVDELGVLVSRQGAEG